MTSRWAGPVPRPPSAFVDAPYRFVVLPGLSHWIPDEAPDVLAEIILERIAG